MSSLTRAHNELFRRTPDEAFPTLAALVEHCRQEQQQSLDRWELPQALRPISGVNEMKLGVGNDGEFLMSDWSFGQLCKLSRVKKDTVNRLSPDTAKRLFCETLPHGNKPLQVFTRDKHVRSLSPASYTRVFNVDVLSIVEEVATDFRAPHQAGAGNGGTGLYCGEQDMFAFLIDPTGWAEINGEAFAPGFFVWNSEVGRRSIGVETFWFQAVCGNHIVWDAVEVVEYRRKHTANVHESLGDIRRIVESLVASRDERRDGFVKVVRRAMETKLGDCADDVALTLAKHGFSKALVDKAMERSAKQGRFTIFSIVDALTRLSGNVQFAGTRTEADQKAARLLALAA